LLPELRIGVAESVHTLIIFPQYIEAGQVRSGRAAAVEGKLLALQLYWFREPAANERSSQSQ
jgi:hypothetical protein